MAIAEWATTNLHPRAENNALREGGCLFCIIEKAVNLPLNKFAHHVSLLLWRANISTGGGRVNRYTAKVCDAQN